MSVLETPGIPLTYDPRKIYGKAYFIPKLFLLQVSMEFLDFLGNEGPKKLDTVRF